MFKGKVVGTLVATVKQEGLRGIKLLAVQTYKDDKPDKIIIVADGIGVSGMGDMVYLVKSREASMTFDREYIPIDAVISGVIEEYNKN